MKAPVQDELPLFDLSPDEGAVMKQRSRTLPVDKKALSESESKPGCETAFEPLIPAEDTPAAEPGVCTEGDLGSTGQVQGHSEIGTEPASHPERAVIISIHDVSPHTLPDVKRILAELEAIGAREFSLLVVANHHRRGHLFDDPDFCRWLQERVFARGDEAVIHGYFHHRDPRPVESLRDKVTTRFYTKGEGEFFDIAGADAIRIVNEARTEFRTLGLDPRGFIAPAWLLSEGAEIALRTLGFDYTTHLRTVEDLAAGVVYQSQSLVWSTRSGWRRAASRLWNASLFRRLHDRSLMRIGIHPPDIQHPAVWRQVVHLTRSALADRTPISYLRWVESSRSPEYVLKS